VFQRNIVLQERVTCQVDARGKGSGWGVEEGAALQAAATTFLNPCHTKRHLVKGGNRI